MSLQVRGPAWGVSQCRGAMLLCTACDWPGVNKQVSRAHLDMIVMCYNPSSKLATHAINPLSVCFTEINVEAAVDVQVLCTADHEVFLEVWCGYCMLLLLHISLGGVVQTL